MTTQKFVTRIAPSPTGFFHLGTARTAYFNWLAARATGGSFLLRIDDTDVTRNDSTFVDVIYRAMDYLRLDYDLTFAQSSRTARYLDAASKLIQQGRAVKRDGAIYLAYPLGDGVGATGFLDSVLGFVATTANDRNFVDNMVLVKSNGSPTYHFASVIDDIDHGVNYVIRGADHISNTMKQVALYLALDAVVPLYAHVGLLHDLTTKRKLSKSAGAPSLLDYQRDGIDSDAMCNFLLRLGWGPKVDDKSASMITRDRALSLFLDGGKMRATGAMADFKMLQSLHRKYVAMKKQVA